MNNYMFPGEGRGLVIASEAQRFLAGFEFCPSGASAPAFAGER